MSAIFGVSQNVDKTAFQDSRWFNCEENRARMVNIVHRSKHIWHRNWKQGEFNLY